MRIADSITQLDAAVRGRPVICGSHGGRYPASIALALGVSGVAFSDAGFGLERAGVAGIGWLDEHGVPAFSVSHLSARIGDARDLCERGIVSCANEVAAAHGVRNGMRVAEAIALLPNGDQPKARPHRTDEARHVLGGFGPVPVLALDSNSLVTGADVGSIVVTGSHGALLGGDPRTCIKHRVFAAFFNDAGVGIDRAGTSRLPALDARGIAGCTVAADSARIGEGLSTYGTGVVSHVNGQARAFGVEPGIAARAAVEWLATAWIKQRTRSTA